MFNKILAAIDGSPTSEKVLATAVDMATHYQAELIALSVAEVPEVVAMVDEVDEIRRSADDYYREIGEGAVGYAKSRGVKLRHWSFAVTPRTKSSASPRPSEWT